MSEKISEVKMKIFTRNDIYRIAGILLVIGGQFMAKSIFSGFGVQIETNVIQFSGLALVLLPFILRYMQKKKETPSPEVNQNVDNR